MGHRRTRLADGVSIGIAHAAVYFRDANNCVAVDGPTIAWIQHHRWSSVSDVELAGAGSMWMDTVEEAGVRRSNVTMKFKDFFQRFFSEESPKEIY